MRFVVLDTNVLLLDPHALVSYPDDTVIIPEIVLAELDKIKIARTDSDTRYRGREITRKLFELCKLGDLIKGVTLPNDGHLRIEPFDTTLPLPEGLSSKNPDDRIITTAYRLMRASSADDDEVVLVTNDLNMLLKAQTLGVPFEHLSDNLNNTFAKRFIIRPAQKYRTPIVILAIAIALFAATLVISTRTSTAQMQQSTSSTAVTAEFRNFLDSKQLAGLDALISLQSNPNDTSALITVANLYNTYYGNVVASEPTTALTYAKSGVQYYKRYLAIVPDDQDARASLGLLEFYTGDTDGALSDLQTAIAANPNHVQANYNLGIVYFQGVQDTTTAKTYFENVLTLTSGNTDEASINSSAQSYLDQIATSELDIENATANGGKA